MLTQERLKEVLHYDQDTGVFTWLVTRGSQKAGTIAGRVRKSDGYLRVKLSRIEYVCHRLAWLYVYGYFPETGIDHKDRDKTNNSISNLREVSHQCNMRNTKIYKSNKSGVKGVYWVTDAKKWRVQMTIAMTNVYLGYFDDFNDAVCARRNKEIEVGWPECDLTRQPKE